MGDECMWCALFSCGSCFIASWGFNYDNGGGGGYFIGVAARCGVFMLTGCGGMLCAWVKISELAVFRFVLGSGRGGCGAVDMSMVSSDLDRRSGCVFLGVGSELLCGLGN